MTNSTPWSKNLPSWFYDDESDEQILQQFDEPLDLQIGDGLIWGDGGRYRVVDRWVSLDHHGRFDIGVHYWLQYVEATETEDRPRRAAPSYFDN